MSAPTFSGLTWDEEDYDEYLNDDGGGFDEFNDEDEDNDVYEEEGNALDEIEQLPDEQTEAAKEIAKVEIEGDFNRLISGMRNPDRNAADGAQSGGFQFVIDEDPNIDFHDELRAASNIGRRRGRRGDRSQKALSPEVKKMLGDAMLAYVNEHFDQAIPLLREIIRIEPNEHSAWSMLAKCHDELGDKPQALQLEIMAAHLMEPDKDVWRDLGRRSREMGYMQQAIYCFRKIISIDPKDVDALWDRSFLLKETGYLRNALTGFMSILQIYPHVPEVLEQLRFILVELNDIPAAIKLYQEAFDFYTSNQPIPGSECEFGARHLMALADCYNSVGDPVMAIKTIRTGARWLDGRINQRHWENAPDDREFDVEGYARSGPGPVLLDGLPQGFYPLDVNLRHRLAVARLKLGDDVEGKMHCSIILALNVLDYSVLFNEIADAYFERSMYSEALDVYQELAEVEETSNFHILLQIGLCHRNLGNYDSAVEVYLIAIAADPQSTEAKMKLAEVYEMTNQSRKALELVQEVIEIRRAKESALSSHPPAQDTADGETGTSLFTERKQTASAKREKANRLTTFQLQELEKQREEDNLASFEKIKELEEKMDGGDKEALEEWLKEANGVIETFRSTRPLFPSNRYAQFRGIVPQRFLHSKSYLKDTERHEKDMAARLQLDIEDTRKKYGKDAAVTEFRGVPFDKWLLLFTKYAFILAKEGQYALADETLRHVSQSNAFVDFHSQTTIWLALLACAIRQKDYSAIIEHCRRLMRAHQFNNDLIRLLLVAHGTGLHGTESLINTKLQKAVLRELRLYEDLLQGRPLKWKAAFSRWVISEGKDKNDADGSDEDEQPQTSKNSWTNPLAVNPSPFKATKESPVLIALSGLENLCSRNFQSAVFYLLRTYEMHSDDPLICLSIAIAYVSRAMQRQVDNRHHMVAEALAFLDRYRSLRSEDGLTDEVEFNFGRLFQQLGLHSLAVKHYKAVLDIVSNRMDAENGVNNLGVSREAAYNLGQIYVMTGAGELARDVYRQWLSL